MPDGITRDEIICTASDDANDLDKCLESTDEQIISSLITINSKNWKKKLEMPVRVYVPITKHDRILESTLKFKIKGKKWRTEKPLHEEHISKMIPDVTLVGVKIPTEHLDNVQCVAVARYKRDATEVDESGKVYEPEIDRNIKLKFPPKAFRQKTTVCITVVPRPDKKTESASKKYKELKNMKIAASYIISCENNIRKDSDFEMCDIADTQLPKNQSVSQETLSKCRGWLVNNMNPDDDVFSDIFDSAFVDELKTQDSRSDKNRHILSKLQDSKERDFDKFVECLKLTQPDVANRIINDKLQVNLSRRAEKEKTEEENGSDFSPGFEEEKDDLEQKAGTLLVVSKKTGRSWEIVPEQASKNHPKARFVKLTAGHDKFQILGLVVPDGMSDEDICRAAEILESLSCITNVSVICRQKHTNPHDVIIQCVKTEDLRDTFQHLEALGYSEGPAESSEFEVIDGDEIEMKVEPNLRFSNSLLKAKFFKNLSFERYSGHLTVVNKGDQLDGEKYYGHLTYNVLSRRQSMKQNGALIIYVPKSLKEIFGNFPYTLDVPVKALSKFISWQLTKDNLNSTRWVKHAGYLTECDKHMYHQITQHVDEERKGAKQRERFEMFILYWASHYAQYNTDKIEKIITSHHDQNLEAEARQFIKPYLPEKGILSNDNLEKMANVIANDWQMMAKIMGFSSEDISNITINQTLAIKQALRMLDLWRLSDSAIQKGTDLIKSLHGTAKALKCETKLLSIISNYV